MHETGLGSRSAQLARTNDHFHELSSSGSLSLSFCRPSNTCMWAVDDLNKLLNSKVALYLSSIFVYYTMTCSLCNHVFFSLQMREPKENNEKSIMT
jgi:hypothetical protein